MNGALVPELRFPEFEGAWTKYHVEDVSEFVTSGSRDWAQYYAENGAKFIRMTNVPRVGTTLLLDDMRYVSLPGSGADGKRTSLAPGDILISITAELGKVGLVPDGLGEAYINQHNALVRPRKENVTSSFLATLLSTSKSRRSLNRLNDAGAKSALNLPTVRRFPIVVPEKAEQQKVASFLDVVSRKLDLLNEKKSVLEDYKRGVMQRLFSRALRFTRNDGSAFPDWAERKLGEIAQRSTAKNSDMALARVLTNSATQGVIDQGDYFDKDIANAANIGGYYIVRRGDFVYNPRISVSAPVGPIKRNNLADGVMSPLYTVFRFKADDTDFFTQFFETCAWHRYMHSVANFGARHDRMAITTGDFMAMPLPYPHPDEQRKIADFLSAIDAKIDAVSTQVLEMETFKKGLLQKMFV